MTFDVIIVGARVAGAASAMLMARAGIRVLLVDRARFPSDTLSSHQVQLPGVACLHRWGLLERLEATGVTPIRRVRFDPGDIALVGDFPMHDGVDALYSPRRTVLDKLLLDAAVEAGAEVRTAFDVEDLLRDGDRVTGIRGRSRGSSTTSATEHANLVIGADGKHSTVAVAAGARRYREHPSTAMACYTYWSGLSTSVGELYQRPGRTVAVFPTNDDLTMVYVAAPLAELDVFRTDTSGAYLRSLDVCGDLGDRVRAAIRAERFRIAPDQPNFMATPYGPGWALVGDAGLSMDSISAQGISNALCHAESLAAAVTGARSIGPALTRRLRSYQRGRDAHVRAMFDFTVDLAAFRPRSKAETALLEAIADRPAEISRFLGAFAGAEPMNSYLGPRNIIRLLGLRGAARAAIERARTARRTQPTSLPT